MPRSQMIEQMQTEVQTLSTVQHPNIVQLLGSSTDGEEPCLVYALMEGGSLQDRLACSGVWKVALTARERIFVLSGHVVGTHVYMSPEYKNGQPSTKIDAYAFGLVMLEALTGYSILTPATGYINLLCMFEEELDTADKLLPHLDKRLPSTSWDPHEAQQIATLHSIAERCLEHRRNRRPEILDIIPELEAVCQEIEALEPERPETDNQECVMCFESGSDVSWMMLRPCGHVCVCSTCCTGLDSCPLCQQAVLESFLAFL